MSADYDDAGFIVASTYREYVIHALAEHPQTPSTMAEGDDTPNIAHVSRSLSELRDRGLVELLVPEDRKKGRIYGLTEDGEDHTRSRHRVKRRCARA